MVLPLDDVGIVPYGEGRTAADLVGVDALIDPNRKAADGAHNQHRTISVTSQRDDEGIVPWHRWLSMHLGGMP